MSTQASVAHIDIVCSNCNSHIRVPAAYAGRTGRCRKCGTSITISAIQSAPQALHVAVAIDRHRFLRFAIGGAGALVVLFALVLVSIHFYGSSKRSRAIAEATSVVNAASTKANQHTSNNEYEEALHCLASARSQLNVSAVSGYSQDLRTRIDTLITDVKTAKQAYEQATREKLVSEAIGRANSSIRSFEFASARQHLTAALKRDELSGITGQDLRSTLESSLQALDAKEKDHAQKLKQGYIIFEKTLVLPSQRKKMIEARFKESPLFPAIHGDRCAYINANGTIVIGPRFLNAAPFLEGLASIQDSEGRAVINTSGTVVARLPYDATDQGFHEGMLAVKSGSKWGFCDEKGALVIPADYDAALGFCESLAPVKIGDKWGFIDTSGQPVLSPQYRDAFPFSEGLAAVSDNAGRWGFIDRKGTWIIAPEYSGAHVFSEGLAVVSTEQSRWGYIDKKGAFVIQPTLRAGDDFGDGLAAVAIGDGDSWGYIDQTGQVVIQPTCRRRREHAVNQPV